MNIPHSRVNAIKFIHRFLNETDVTGKTVIDLSAGKGYVASLWEKAGAEVLAFDLYPELMENKNIKSQKIDLNEPFPIVSNSADFVVLMETIDHISEQRLLFLEISRIMKKGGILILTKPNNSNITGRLANLWLESERGDMFLPNEHAVIGYDNDRVYMGRIFLIGIQKIRTLAGLASLRIHKIHKNQFGVSSLIFFILIGWIFLLRTYLTLRKVSNNASELEKSALKEQYFLNQNPTILFHKHLCITLEKLN